MIFPKLCFIDCGDSLTIAINKPNPFLNDDSQRGINFRVLAFSE